MTELLECVYKDKDLEKNFQKIKKQAAFFFSSMVHPSVFLINEDELHNYVESLECAPSSKELCRLLRDGVNYIEAEGFNNTSFLEKYLQEDKATLTGIISDGLFELESSLGQFQTLPDYSETRKKWYNTLTRHKRDVCYPRDEEIESIYREEQAKLPNYYFSTNSVEEEEICDDIDYFQSLIDAALSFNEYMRPEAMTWKDDIEKEEWIAAVESAVSTEQLGELLVLFTRRISTDRSYGSWAGDKEHRFDHLLESPTLRNLARELGRIEVSVTWGGVIDKFKEDRSPWLKPLQRPSTPNREFFRKLPKSARK